MSWIEAQYGPNTELGVFVKRAELGLVHPCECSHSVEDHGWNRVLSDGSEYRHAKCTRCRCQTFYEAMKEPHSGGSFGYFFASMSVKEYRARFRHARLTRWSEVSRESNRAL